MVYNIIKVKIKERKMKKLLSFVITLVMVFAMAPAVFADWKENAAGNRWYVGEDGEKYQGLKKIDGKYYFFDRSDKDHYMKTGFVIISSGGKKSVYFFGKDGSMVFNKWIEEDGYKCYFGSDGKAVSGWKIIGKKQYYFGNRIIEDNPERGIAAASASRIVGTKIYLFNEDNSLSDEEPIDVGQIPIMWLMTYDPYAEFTNTLSTIGLEKWKVDLDDSKEILFLKTDSYKTRNDEKIYSGKYPVTLYKNDLNASYGYTDDKLSSVYLTKKFTDMEDAAYGFAQMSNILTGGYGAAELVENFGKYVATPELTKKNSKSIATADGVGYQIFTAGSTVIRLDMMLSDDDEYIVQIRFYDNSK
jgi:hypothetical protein